MVRTTTNSLVPFQPFHLGRMKLRHTLRFRQSTGYQKPKGLAPGGLVLLRPLRIVCVFMLTLTSTYEYIHIPIYIRFTAMMCCRFIFLPIENVRNRSHSLRLRTVRRNEKPHTSDMCYAEHAGRLVPHPSTCHTSTAVVNAPNLAMRIMARSSRSTLRML